MSGLILPNGDEARPRAPRCDVPKCESAAVIRIRLRSNEPGAGRELLICDAHRTDVMSEMLVAPVDRLVCSRAGCCNPAEWAIAIRLASRQAPGVIAKLQVANDISTGEPRAVCKDHKHDTETEDIVTDAFWLSAQGWWMNQVKGTKARPDRDLCSIEFIALTKIAT